MSRLQTLRPKSVRSQSRSLLRAVRGALALACGVTLAILGACDRNIEAYEPGEEPSQPDLARIFPAPPPGDDSGAGPGAAGGRGGVDTGGSAREAFPPSRAEAGPGAGATAPAANAAAIQGVIEIDPSLAGKAPPGAILFVIARNAGAPGGPPLAVLRIPAPSFPLAFQIGPENVMIPSMQFAGQISLSARLDADGNAMTRGAGDVSSPVVEPLEPGAVDVALVLSQGG